MRYEYCTNSSLTFVCTSESVSKPVDTSQVLIASYNNTIKQKLFIIKQLKCYGNQSNVMHLKSLCPHRVRGN